MPVPGGFTKLSQLTDVNFSTAPTDGQVMVWDALATFTATNSPLRWNGNDYKQPNLGATHTPSLVYIFSSTGREIYADGQTFYNESQAQDLHIGLVTWTDTTQYTGLGGSLTFPFEYGDSQNSVTFRVRVTQTSGSSKSVYCELHFYWDV